MSKVIVTETGYYRFSPQEKRDREILIGKLHAMQAEFGAYMVQRDTVALLSRLDELMPGYDRPKFEGALRAYAGLGLDSGNARADRARRFKGLCSSELNRLHYEALAGSSLGKRFMGQRNLFDDIFLASVGIEQMKSRTESVSQ